MGERDKVEAEWVEAFATLALVFLASGIVLTFVREPLGFGLIALGFGGAWIVNKISRDGGEG